MKFETVFLFATLLCMVGFMSIEAYPHHMPESNSVSKNFKNDEYLELQPYEEPNNQKNFEVTSSNEDAVIDEDFKKPLIKRGRQCLWKICSWKIDVAQKKSRVFSS